MKTISLKGILVGGVIDVLATNILSLPVVFYVMWRLQSSHVPKDQIQSVLLSTIHGSPALFSVQAIVGVGCSALGGYVAARIAKRKEGLHGALSAWLCIVIGVYSLAAGTPSASVGLTIADLFIAPLAGVTGGYLYLKSKK